MNPSKVKKAILVILVVFMAIVWGRNLSIFWRSEPSHETIEKTGSSLKAATPKMKPIEYSSPKTNPFAKAVTNAPGSPQKKEKSKEPPPAAPERVSNQYILSGFVDRPPHSQIVLQKKSGGTQTIQLGDSLTKWELLSIQTDRAIFASGKLRDTVYLKK